MKFEIDLLVKGGDQRTHAIMIHKYDEKGNMLTGGEVIQITQRQYRRLLKFGVPPLEIAKPASV